MISFSEKNVLRKVSWQNPEVASSLDKIRQRSYSKRSTSQQSSSSPIEYDRHDIRYSLKVNSASSQESRSAPDFMCTPRARPSCSIGYLLFLIGIGAFLYVLGPTVVRLLVNNWRIIILSAGGCLIGAGMILIIQQFDTNPLTRITPPDANTENPLEELEKLANRTVSRLRSAYQIQLSIVISTAFVLFAVLSWSIVMISQDRIAYGASFGSGGVGMLILSKWKWQPFDHIGVARKLADDADILATGLRLRMKSIMAIQDPKERAQAQWDAVSDYLDRS